MKIGKLLAILFFFTFSLSLKAVVYRIIKAENEAGKKCFLFAVIHQVSSEINNANTLQRRDFVDLALQLGAAVIVEDSFVYNGEELHNNLLTYRNNDYSCKWPLLLFFKQNKDMLYGLSAYCYHAGIPTTNVEFRYFDLFYCRQLYKDFIHLVNTQIKSYEDGPVLNELYKYIKDEFIKEFDMVNKKFAPYPKYELISSSWYTYGCDMNLATSHLLDMRIIHQFSIYEKQYDTIFIAAGGWHISNITDYLIKLGYTIKKTVDIHEAALVCEASLSEIFVNCFEHKPLNEKKSSLIVSLLDAKNFCDTTPFKYVINRYGSTVLLGLMSYGFLSLIYPLDSTETHSSLIHGLIAASILTLGFKFVPKILRTPLTKNNVLY